MFSINDTVLYGTTGVCRIEGISEVRIGRERKNYYVLRPVAQDTSTVYVPTDNETLLSKMHKLLTRKEIDKIIKDLPDDCRWIDDNAQRMSLFEQTVKSCDRAAMIKMMHMFILRQHELTMQGKRLHLSDERALHEAERLIYDEFSYVLGIDREKVGAYIFSVFDNK